MPADYGDATIVTLYKGAKSDCGNYRGISLLSIAGKSWPASSSTSWSPASLRSADPKAWPQYHTHGVCCASRQRGVYWTTDRFVFRLIKQIKTFDTVNRTRGALWAILKKRRKKKKKGCPYKFIALMTLPQQHDRSVVTAPSPSISPMAWNRAAHSPPSCSACSLCRSYSKQSRSPLVKRSNWLDVKH